MRLVLDSHENIAIAPETGLMRVVQANKHVPFWLWGSEWYTRLGVTEDELDRELAEFYGGFLRRYAEAQGKRRWGEKTPFHSWHVARMAHLWPRALFVAMVRHPGANIASLVSKWHTPLPAAISKWKGINQYLALQAESLGDRIVFCRYEDVVLASEPTLRELLERLGESWSASVLQHDVVHRNRGRAHRTRSMPPAWLPGATSSTATRSGRCARRPRASRASSVTPSTKPRPWRRSFPAAT
jgi:hypothetical protein